MSVEEQEDPDPEFSTVDFPNPEEGASALDLSFKKADSVGAVYILANDPDADRLGVAQKDGGKWRILTGNEIGALLGWWLIHTYKWVGHEMMVIARLFQAELPELPIFDISGSYSTSTVFVFT